MLSKRKFDFLSNKRGTALFLKVRYFCVWKISFEIVSGFSKNSSPIKESCLKIDLLFEKNFLCTL